MRATESKSGPLAKSFRRRLTLAETILWAELRRDRIGHHIRRQHPIGPYITDFACAPMKVVIEVDGISHLSENAVARDAQRDAYFKARGWRVLHIQNEDVFKNLNAVLEHISKTLNTKA